MDDRGPVASTSRVPYSPALSQIVPSSDAGEHEEWRSRTLGERYWKQGAMRSVLVEQEQDVNMAEAQAEPSSEDELAMSPLRPRIRPSMSLHGAEDVSQAALSRSGSADLSTFSRQLSPLASPSLRISNHTSPALLLAPSRRSPSPALSVASSDITALISRPRAPLPPSRSPSPSRPSASPLSEPSPRLSSPRRRTASLPASSPPPFIPPDPDPHPIGRSFRTRTVAQLKPYSTEQLKYTKTLLRNGWEGAVVKGLRPVEETPEELKRKKMEQAGRKKDSLGGWLVEEEGTQEEGAQAARNIARARRESSFEEESDEQDEDEEEDGQVSDASMDGLSLLEREARRKEKRDAKAAARAAAKGKGKARKHSPHRKNPSKIDDPYYQPDPFRPSRPKQPRSRLYNSSSHRQHASDTDTETDRPSTSRRRHLNRAESAPPSSSPHPSSRKRSRGDGERGPSRSKGRNSTGTSKKRRQPSGGAGADGRPSSSRPRNHVRADSEPPASSPGHGGDDTAVAGFRRSGMGKPSKGFRAGQNGSSKGRSALDYDILNLPRILSSSSHSASSDDGSGARRSRVGAGRSDGESEQPSEEEEAEDDDDDEAATQLNPSRLELGQKRKRALGFMMPAVFMKKAQADLKLMEKERGGGTGGGGGVGGGEYSSGSELNSGDEEAVERARRERNRAKKRTVPRLLDEPMRLDGDAFTDESGSDGDRRTEEEKEDEEDENNAVGMWMKSFAPNKGRAGADDDVIDRFLRRAKRPVRSTSGAGRKKGEKRGGRAAGEREKGKGKEGQRGTKQKKGGQSRPDDGIYVVGGSRAGSAPAAPPRRRTRAVALDTEQTLFAFAGLQQNGAETDDDVVVVSPRRRAASPRPPPPRPAATSAALSLSLSTPAAALPAPPDGEVWASFGKFSHDFGIQRLPAGVQFDSPDSFIKNGHLFSLVSSSGLPTSSFSADALGFTLDSTMAPDDLATLLPQICDAVFDVLSSLSPDDSSALAGIGSVLRFLGSYVSTTLANNHAGSERSNFGATTVSHLERLETRLDTVASTSKAYKRSRILVSWYVVDVAARLQKVSADTVNSERIRRLVAVLVGRLVQHGLNRTMKSLKTATDGVERGAAAVSDVTVEAWVGLVSLALHAVDFGGSALSEEQLWEIALDETKKTLAGRVEGGPGFGEVLSYTTMTLCAISQFSPSGISTSTPRLHAYWPAAMQTLDAIQPSALSAPSTSLSSTAIARRDRYLWTLFARCLVFVERWGWSIECKGDVLSRLYALLNARRLADLTTDRTGDIPSFLQDLDELDKLRLDPNNDTAFTIFLKLLISAANALPSVSEGEKRERTKALTRLITRFTPLTSSWSRTTLELHRSPSILLNNYSLQLTFAILLPSSSSSRVECAKKLLDFSAVDDEPRKTCIRSILHFALAFRQVDLPLATVLEWFAGVTTALKSEYVEIERQRRKERRWGGQGEAAKDQGNGDPLWLRAVMITMVLRSVQMVLKWKKKGEKEQAYPDSTLLHPAWTSNLLKSPLALDPMVGREAIRTVTCFLDTRRAALPRPAPPPAPPPEDNDEYGVSQEEYGIDDLDFDDPALNAMLGIDSTATVDEGKSREEDVREKDKAFGELVKSRLSLAFFDLISKIFLDTPGTAPMVIDRAGYAHEAIDCWVRCIAVAVEHRVTDWRPYLGYGDQAAMRISDTVARRDVGLFLAVEILKHDPAVYADKAEELLETWFASIVARQLTSQHEFTSFLLNVDATHGSTISPLFKGVPLNRSPVTGRIEVEQFDLLDNRDAILRVIFANAARIVQLSSSTSIAVAAARNLHGAALRPTIPRGTVLNLIRSLLSSMRDNLSTIRNEVTRSRYAPFVKSTLAALLAAGAEGGKKGPFDETTLPDMRTLRSLLA